MTILGCKVRKEFAAKVKEKAKKNVTNVNAILLKAIKNVKKKKKRTLGKISRGLFLYIKEVITWQAKAIPGAGEVQKRCKLL